MRSILLSARGYAVPDIARIVECDEATVRQWIVRFEAGACRRCATVPDRGRRPRVVAHGPASVGYAGSVWAVVTLKLYLFVTSARSG